MADEQMEDGEAGYNNLHRAFLQAFLSRSILGIDEIKPILAAVMTAHGMFSACRQSSTTNKKLFLQKAVPPSQAT